MRVLVTGANGFLGSWVLRKLIEAGYTARAFCRKTSNVDSIADLLANQAEQAFGDVLDAESVAAALKDCQAVIHTAGVPHFSPDDKERMFAVNAAGAGIVMRAAQAARVERAVLTSSVAAMGGSFETRIANEETPSNAETIGIDYCLSKWQGEKEAQAVPGLPLIVLRPVVVLGPGDAQKSSTTTVLGFVRRKMPVYIEGRAGFGDVRDMATAHVAALEKGRLGETYLLGGHNLTISELVSAIEDVTGVAPPPRVPYAVAYAVAGLSEAMARLRHQHTPLSRQLVKAGHLCTWVSSEKARAELGYEVRPLAESMRDTILFALRRGFVKPTTSALRALLES